MRNSTWSDGPLKEKLVELHNQSLSSARIAAEINQLFGTKFTRSAIIGARHRIGLCIPSRATWTVEQRMAYTGGGYKPRVAKPAGSQRGKWPRLHLELRTWGGARPIRGEIDIPVEQRKTFAKLEKNDCRWPVGEPGTPDFFFCGGQKIEGHSYCAGHCRIAYHVPQKPKAVNLFTGSVQLGLQF